MGAFLDSFQQQWNKMSRPMQIGGSVLVAGVFFSLIFLAFFSSTDFQPLFTDLKPDDAGAIVSVLRDSGIPYQIGDNGSTIRVPRDQVYETRLTLAGQGLPRGGVVGFEIFQSTRLGETEADRQLRFLWALQGELTRTIRELDEITDARVHIVLPRRSLFIQESQPSTASVLLQLRPGARLAAQQVRGIAHLISTSVEGLTPENVTIIDTRGNVLSDTGSTGLNGRVLAERFEVERTYERSLEDSVTAMLERIYGYGQVVVRVNAELDFDVLEEHSEIFEPIVRDSGVVRSEQTFTESYRSEGDAGGAGGVPGVDSNVPGYVGSEDDGTSEYERRELTTNYEVNRIERRFSSTPGGVKLLSVSVWVDGELQPAELAAIEDSVSRSIGLRPERGDSIFVDSVPFETSVLGEVPLEQSAAEFPMGLAMAVGVGLLLILLLLLRSRRREAPSEPQIDLTIGEEELVETPLSPEERQKREVRQRLQKAAKEKPNDIARLVKAWLAEE